MHPLTCRGKPPATEWAGELAVQPLTCRGKPPATELAGEQASDPLTCRGKPLATEWAGEQAVHRLTCRGKPPATGCDRATEVHHTSAPHISSSCVCFVCFLQLSLLLFLNNVIHLAFLDCSMKCKFNADAATHAARARSLGQPHLCNTKSSGTLILMS